MEIELSTSDNIISKTDLKGNISYVNKSFVNISEYKEEELLGQPHNILRHEQMPRAIFETLWETIKDGNELYAYVINETANKNFYWVLAHISPIMDESKNITGYQSIRKRANPLALETIKPIYEQMLALEQSGDTQDSSTYLETIISEQNTTYSKFISSLQLKR